MSAEADDADAPTPDAGGFSTEEITLHKATHMASAMTNRGAHDCAADVLDAAVRFYRGEVDG